MSTGYYDHKPGHQQKQQQQRFSRKQQMMIWTKKKKWPATNYKTTKR